MFIATAISCAVALSGTAAAQAPGGLSSDNVEFVSNLKPAGFSNGGRLLGKLFYFTTGAGLTIFDVSDPEHPRELGGIAFRSSNQPAPGGPSELGYMEDIDTNGRILLHKQGPLAVIDVSDPTAPKEIGLVDAPGQHTVSCVLDCTWAYGSNGAIFDLRDPSKPILAGDWVDQMEAGVAHDVTEVAPGIVLAATVPVVLMDVTNPTKPVELARADPPGFTHGTLWPHKMADDFALIGGEGVGPGCDEQDHSSFQTWDTRGWQTTKTLRLVAEFKMSPGTLVDGRSPTTEYCTHWFDTHPAYRNGGLVSIAWYEHGTRLLEVSPDGRIEEVGYFLPYGGQAWAAVWITDRILYALDHRRGIDILRWTGEIPPPGPGHAAPPSRPPEPSGPPARATSFDDLIRLPSARRCVTKRSLAIRVLRRRSDPVTSVTVRLGGRQALTARGRSLTRPLRLRRLPRGRFSLQVKVRTRSGFATAGQRSYNRCR